MQIEDMNEKEGKMLYYKTKLFLTFSLVAF